MLKIHCSDLTIGECKELRALISKQDGIAVVDMQPDLSGIQHRSLSYIGGDIPQFWPIVAPLAGTGGTAVVAAGKSFLEEAGKDAYKVLKEWLSKRHNLEVQVTLYDANNRVLEKIGKGR